MHAVIQLHITLISGLLTGVLCGFFAGGVYYFYLRFRTLTEEIASLGRDCEDAGKSIADTRTRIERTRISTSQWIEKLEREEERIRELLPAITEESQSMNIDIPLARSQQVLISNHPDAPTVQFDEAMRQMIVRALAINALVDPGFEYLSREISQKLAAEEMFDNFRKAMNDRFHPQYCRLDPVPPIAPHTVAGRDGLLADPEPE